MCSLRALVLIIVVYITSVLHRPDHHTISRSRSDWACDWAGDILPWTTLRGYGANFTTPYSPWFLLATSAFTLETPATNNHDSASFT